MNIIEEKLIVLCKIIKISSLYNDDISYHYENKWIIFKCNVNDYIILNKEEYDEFYELYKDDAEYIYDMKYRWKEFEVNNKIYYGQKLKINL